MALSESPRGMLMAVVVVARAARRESRVVVLKNIVSVRFF